ncbi:MAG: hypothetical protein KAJ18_11120 [Candidatus Omnitrophica bacterium]|nr:hypothetical protein [Candidatus Omnitrophota bacterium]
MKTYPIFSKPFARYVAAKFIIHICIYGDRKDIRWAGRELFINSPLSRSESNLIYPCDKEHLKLINEIYLGISELEIDLGFLDYFVKLLPEINSTNCPIKISKSSLFEFISGIADAAHFSEFGEDTKKTKRLLSDAKKINKIQIHNEKRFHNLLTKLTKRYIDPFEGGACCCG